MFFFLSLREGSNGTIEPDIPTSTTSSAPLITAPKDQPPSSNSNFGEYLKDWNTSAPPALIRKCICFIALFLHIPINFISIWSYGFGFKIFLGIIWSLLNLFCVGMALWKLDVMRGERLIQHKVYNRLHFDYVLLGLFCIWAISFGILVFARLRVRTWIYVIYYGWPVLVTTDLVCFFVGWFATWRDVSVAPLG